MALFKPGALVVYRMQKSSVHPGSRGYIGIERVLLSSWRLLSECTTYKKGGGGL